VRVEGQDQRFWAKRYALNSLTSSLDAEAERVGREVRVLQDFSGKPGFYRYVDRSLQGHHDYVIVERVEGVALHRWIEREHPTRARKLSVLKQVAEALERLAKATVVHRALAPTAVRVGSDDCVTLVNFDFCQLASLATVDVRARAQLDPAYLSRDAATPGRKLSPADDSFSFGKLCCLALAGKLPFETPGIDPRFLRKPELWNEYASAYGITDQELTDIRKMLAPVREERPVGQSLTKLLEQWVS
jgi:serine/threonine protein kinase